MRCLRAGGARRRRAGGRGCCAGCSWRLACSCAKAAGRLWRAAGRARRLLPLAGGLVLGASMALLPHAGLPGSDALSFQLVGDWPSIAPAVLVATALVRVALVGFLLNLGWSGGPFLPLVYGAICLALGISGLAGADPGPCVAALLPRPRVLEGALAAGGPRRRPHEP